MSNFLKIDSILQILTRGYKTQRKGKNLTDWKGEGIQFFGFKYYPRNPETFQDPPYEPTKLFRIQRIKPFKGRPYWERQVLKQLQLLGPVSEINVVKNTPQVNAMLWRVKHLIKIDPITYPNGFPEDEKNATLKENGELVVIKTVNHETRLKLAEDFRTNEKRLDGDTLRRQSREKWNNAW